MRQTIPRGVLTRLETSRVVVYSLVAGVIVGVLGSGLRLALEFLANARTYLLSFRPPGTPGEGGLLHAFGEAGIALLIAVPVLLIIAAALRPHGRDPLEEAVGRYHEGSGPPSPMEATRSLGASTLAYLSLAGVGRDGPFTAVGNLSARVLVRVARLSTSEGRTLSLACMGAALGLVLHAPLAAAVLVVELLYRRFEFEVEVLLPAVLASVTAYALYGALFGFGPLISPNVLQSPQLAQVPLYALLSLLVAAAAWLVTVARSALPSPGESRVPRVAVAAVLGAVGVVGALFAPRLLGDGSGWLQLGVSGFVGPESMSQVLLRLPVVVLVAWLGLGGTVIASLSAGGLLGLSIAGLLPGLGLDPVVAGLVGAAAFLTTSHNTPVAATLLIAAWGGDALLPALLAGTLLAHAASGEASLFPLQVRARTDSPAHALAVKLAVPPAAAAQGPQVVPEVQVPGGSPPADETLYRVALPSAWRDVPAESVVWPHGVQYVAVVREGDVQLARPGQVFHEGDELVLLATPEQYAQFSDALGGLRGGPR